MTLSGVRRLFTIHDYESMVEVGILGPDDHVELVEGEIVEMPPIGSHHSSVVERLNWLLSRRLNLDEVIVRVQDFLRLSIHNEPQPDIAVVRFREDFYNIRHPGPEEVLLVIDVAASSLMSELGVKAPISGTAGVPELWVVDVEDRSVEVFREPGPDSYEQRVQLRGTDFLSPVGLPLLLLTVDEVLGPEPEPMPDGATN